MHRNERRPALPHLDDGTFLCTMFFRVSFFYQNLFSHSLQLKKFSFILVNTKLIDKLSPNF